MNNSSTKGILLGVNIDHCATLREARYQSYDRHRGEIVEPDPIAFALEVERAGADGITVHPREDARHIRRADVIDLKAALQIPLNMEMACTDDMLAFALELKPRSVCLVPENREEVTTEGGLEVAEQMQRVGKIVETLLQAGILTSLFIDPDPKQIDAAIKLQSTMIELHTGAYANAYFTPERSNEFERILAAADYANSQGIVVNLGHGINYVNIKEMRQVPRVHEMNIGHSIISRALFTGIREAVREMKQKMNPHLRG